MTPPNILNYITCDKTENQVNSEERLFDQLMSQYETDNIVLKKLRLLEYTYNH